MENTTYVTGETARVLSATTAARTRSWLRGEVTQAPVSTLLRGEKCVSNLTFAGHAGSMADHGTAINPFPTRSGPPCRTA